MRSVNANLLEINQADKTGNATPLGVPQERLADLRFNLTPSGLALLPRNPVISGHGHFRSWSFPVIFILDWCICG